MSSLVTREAPDFVAAAATADHAIEEQFRLSTHRGRYVVILFYPLDFTFVCPTEILAYDERLTDFGDRDCDVIGVSVDSQFTHLAWRNTPRERGGIGQIGFPLVADLDKSIAQSYGVLHDGAVALRALFLIDREGMVRHAVVNDLPLGRNVEETLRTLDALRFHESRGHVCPANWHDGEPGMEPTAEGVADYLSKYIK